MLQLEFGDEPSPYLKIRVGVRIAVREVVGVIVIGKFTSPSQRIHVRRWIVGTSAMDSVKSDRETSRNLR